MRLGAKRGFPIHTWTAARCGRLGMWLGAFAFLAATSATARDIAVVSRIFQVCAVGIPGLSVKAVRGIDAVEGRITANGSAVGFMIGYNPNLPANMPVTRTKDGLQLPKLSDAITFVAESNGPLGVGANGLPSGYGMERLYAYRAGVIETRAEPVDEVVFIQLWSDVRRRNMDLLRRVGQSLKRCAG